MIIARYSAHIQKDIERNWSSWNFGQEGFKSTKDELDQAVSEITETSPLWISGFDIYPNQVRNCKFGELHQNYWVLIDQRSHGLSCHIIDNASTLEQALEIIKSNPGLYDGTGDGDFVDCSDAKILYSECQEGEWGLHLLEVED